MQLLKAPPATRPIFDVDEPTYPGEQDWSPADMVLVGLSLFTVWATRTGRSLREVPIVELSAQELMDFWADDDLEGQHIVPRTHRSDTTLCR